MDKYNAQFWRKRLAPNWASLRTEASQGGRREGMGLCPGQQERGSGLLAPGHVVPGGREPNRLRRVEEEKLADFQVLKASRARETKQ